MSLILFINIQHGELRKLFLVPYKGGKIKFSDTEEEWVYTGEGIVRSNEKMSDNTEIIYTWDGAYLKPHNGDNTKV